VDNEPAELIILGFPGERADPAVAELLAAAVSQGYVTVLDLAFLSRTPDGLIRVTGAADNLDRVGLGSLDIRAQALISEDHLGPVRDSVKPGTSAAVIVYAHSLAGAVRDAGGTVVLHTQVTPGAVPFPPSAQQPAPSPASAHQPAPWAVSAHQPAPSAVSAHQPAPSAASAQQPAPSAASAQQPAPSAASAEQQAVAGFASTPQQAVAESEEAVRQAEAEVAAAERAAERYATLRPRPVPDPNDLASQLDDLARLREKGALSATEFASAKARLLGA
jgi:hypothetical protein